MFQVDDEPADAARFTATALNPARSVFVSACAGSGKTTLLVGRMTRALLAGVAPSQILAVTFTRKAAAEMRDRLVAALRELAGADDAGLDAALRKLALSGTALGVARERARNLYEQVLCDPRGPDIETFDAWFARIIRYAPTAIELPIDATMAEDAELLVERGWRRFIERLGAQPDGEAARNLAELVKECGAHGITELMHAVAKRRVDWLAAAGLGLYPSVERLAAALEDHAERCRQAAGSAGSVLAQAPSVDDLREFVRVFQFSRSFEATSGPLHEAIALLDAAAPTDEVALDRRLSRLSEALRRAMLTARGHDRQWHGLTGAVRKLLADTEVDAGEYDRRLAQRWDAARAWLARYQDYRLAWLNQRLMALTAHWLSDYQAFKRERRVVDFGDIEMALAALTADATQVAFVQSMLDQRYRQLMFDEFQDTNALQWRIIRDWLMSYAGAGERPSVFIVGDAKQSIYRFRRADTRVFEQARAFMREALEASVLTTDATHRLNVDLVDGLNTVMRDRMDDFRPHFSVAAASAGSMARLALIEYARAAPRRIGELDRAELDRDWLATPRGVDRDDPRYREGEAIAAAIHTERARRAAIGEVLEDRAIMVLARRRAHFAAWEKAMRAAGIAVRSERLGGLLDRLEVGDFEALLRWCADGADSIALVQWLRSPMMAFDEAQLNALYRARTQDPAGRRDWLQALELTRPEVAAQMRQWRESAHRQPVHDFLDAVMHQTDAPACYAAMVAPTERDAVRSNLNELLALALDTDGGRLPGVFAFLERLRALRRAADEDAPDEGKADGINAVRMMTIHAAKGLQAELVIIAGAADSTSEPSRLRPLSDWPPDRQAPRQLVFVRHADSPAFAQWITADRIAADAEDWNLLYVALTRGQRTTLLSGVAAQGKLDPNSWYARAGALPTFTPDPAPPREAAAEPGTRFDWRELPRERCARGARDAQRADAADARALRLGIALHRALELRDAAALDHELELLGLAPADADAVRERAQRVRNLATLREFDALHAAGRARGVSEMELLDAAGQLMRIDRYVETATQRWIIDYKWSIDRETLPEYRVQLARYRAALGDFELAPVGVARPLRTMLIDAGSSRTWLDADLTG